MNDFGALEKLVEAANSSINSNYNLTITLAIFVFINLILTIIDIIFQFKLKNKEKGIAKHNLRESKRIEVQELLYNMLEELTYYDNNDHQSYHQKSNLINKYLTQKRIFLNAEIISITQEFNDYFLSVLADYRNKEYQKEIKILENYCKIFNND